MRAFIMKRKAKKLHTNSNTQESWTASNVFAILRSIFIKTFQGFQTFHFTKVKTFRFTRTKFNFHDGVNTKRCSITSFYRCLEHNISATTSLPHSVPFPIRKYCIKPSICWSILFFVYFVVPVFVCFTFGNIHRSCQTLSVFSINILNLLKVISMLASIVYTFSGRVKWYHHNFTWPVNYRHVERAKTNKTNDGKNFCYWHEYQKFFLIGVRNWLLFAFFCSRFRHVCVCDGNFDMFRWSEKRKVCDSSGLRSVW